MSITRNQVIPIFRMFDVAKAKEFYIDYLGFTIDWEHRFEDNAPLYMQVSLGSLVLHRSEHYGDGTPGSTVFVNVNGLDDYHRELSSKELHTFASAKTTNRGAHRQSMYFHGPPGIGQTAQAFTLPSPSRISPTNPAGSPSSRTMRYESRLHRMRKGAHERLPVMRQATPVAQVLAAPERARRKPRRAHATRGAESQ